jgi:hypothetical protein
MSDQHETDRQWLIEIRTLPTNDLLVRLHFELEHWRRSAINRELDRREALARELQ